jgi:hypothetical protein
MAVAAVMDGIPAVGAGRVLTGRESAGGEQGKKYGDHSHEKHLT